MDKQKQRVLVMNGSAILQTQIGGSWEAGRPVPAPSVKPGIYNLYSAATADPTAVSVGVIVHKDREAVYQQVGAALLKHASFVDAPGVGVTCAVKYEEGRPQVATDSAAIKQSRGRTR